MIHSTNVYLPRGVLRKVVHDVVSHVLNASEATERYTAHRVGSDLVQKSNSHSVANIFKDFLRKWRTARVGINFGVGISYRSILFDAALRAQKLWCQSIYSLSIMIVALESIAVRNTSRLLQSHTAAPVSTHAILVFHCHDLF